MAASKLGSANFEFQVKASGLEPLLPISAEDFKLMRLFHMMVFENVILSASFADQLAQ